jgi:hypothetical protein
VERGTELKAKKPDGLLICDILFDSTYTIRKLTFLGVQKCAACEIGYHRDRNTRALSLKNGSILYEDIELRNRSKIKADPLEDKPLSRAGNIALVRKRLSTNEP